MGELLKKAEVGAEEVEQICNMFSVMRIEYFEQVVATDKIPAAAELFSVDPGVLSTAVKISALLAEQHKVVYDTVHQAMSSFLENLLDTMQSPNAFIMVENLLCFN